MHPKDVLLDVFEGIQARLSADPLDEGLWKVGKEEQIYGLPLFDPAYVQPRDGYHAYTPYEGGAQVFVDAAQLDFYRQRSFSFHEEISGEMFLTMPVSTLFDRNSFHIPAWVPPGTSCNYRRFPWMNRELLHNTKYKANHFLRDLEEYERCGWPYYKSSLRRLERNLYAASP